MSTTEKVFVPDIGDFTDIPVIEVLVKKGDQIKLEDSLITLESDKATMEVPAPFSGTVESINLKPGDSVSKGTLILTMEPLKEEPKKKIKQPKTDLPQTESTTNSAIQQDGPKTIKKQSNNIGEDNEPEKPKSPNTTKVHASPSVRRLAREFGLDLSQIKGSGPKNRILKEDLHSFSKNFFKNPKGRSEPNLPLRNDLPAWPEIDYSRYGEIQIKELTRIKRLSGPALHRNWLNIPHITQHDEADVSELEAFRKGLVKNSSDSSFRLTPLAFVLKTLVPILKKHPQFNSSIANGGKELILKKYFNFGVAVDTPEGLVVPVIKEVNKKGILEIANDLNAISKSAREGKLTAKDLQGGTFSVSSLGGIGGGHFTPIINAPEVAILGLAKTYMKPIWDGSQFNPCLMLPMSLSYDHRAIDGAEGARFITDLRIALSDIRRLLL